MKLMLLRFFLFLSCFLFLSKTSKTQNCILTGINGGVYNLACNQVCSTFTFQIPHIKGTSDYAVNSIPYAPYSYSSGTQITSIYSDDKYSALIPIQFPFCFYGLTYNNMIVGSNGIVTFEQLCANASNAFTLDNTSGAPQPIPYNVGAGPTGIFTTYYPRTAIMGAYYDIDPSSSPLPTRRIEYNLVGTAPCRKMTISFFDIRLFSCTSLIATQQIVMHESTGIIEVFLLNKPLCPGWNDGLAILGIQDETRTKAVAAPGKNCTQWSESNTGYRFTPSGGGSRYVRSELLDMGGTVLATADTATTTVGLLDVSFTNYCPPTGNNQYVVRTTFSACDNPANLLTSLDTITIDRTNGLNAIAATTNTACGPPSGSINVTVPPGVGTAPYTFILDGGAPVVANSPYTFTGVAAGPHTIVVTDASAGCTSNLNVTVNLTNGINANTTSSATSCSGVSNGTITVVPTSGSAPFTYSINGGLGVPGPVPYVFTNLSSGNHTIVVTDASGCVTSPINVTVAVGPGVSANTTSAPTSCLNAANGSIIVTATSGTAPFTFQLDGGAPQSGASPYTFSNVAAGSHTILITDNLGCTLSINRTVNPGPALTTTASKTDALCNGSPTGTITVLQPTIGNAPFEYSLDGSTWQASNVFNGLTAGIYTVFFRESNGCQGSLSITVAQPSALTASTAFVPVVCNGQNNGIITITPGGGVSPYSYSIDGGTTWQTGNVFNTSAGNYTILVRDANNCINTQNINVTEPAAINVTSSNGPASCDGGNDGVIDVAASGGNPGYEYSIDGGSTWQTSTIFNVGPGNYTINVRDNLGCTSVYNTTVTLANNLALTPQTDAVICEGSSTQLALVSNATQYSWSPATGLSDVTVSNPLANPIVTTQYTVTATLGRCSADDVVTVNVNAAPIPDAGADGYICFGQTYQLQASGGTQFQWTPDTYLNSTTIANPVAAATKDITYTLSILSDVNGCPSLTTDEVYIDVTPPIKVTTFPYDTIGYSGDMIQLLAIPNDSDVVNYIWTPSQGLSDPMIPNPVVILGANGDVIQYKVATSTIAGCRGEGFVTVRVYKGPDIYVPTAFTPNGDGRNDRFLPVPVGIKSLNYFRVYNRWGQLLFQTKTLHDGWDGRLQGTPQASGVYVWMIEALTNENKVVTKKGTVTLIR